MPYAGCFIASWPVTVTQLVPLYSYALEDTVCVCASHVICWALWPYSTPINTSNVCLASVACRPNLHVLGCLNSLTVTVTTCCSNKLTGCPHGRLSCKRRSRDHWLGLRNRELLYWLRSRPTMRPASWQLRRPSRPQRLLDCWSGRASLHSLQGTASLSYRLTQAVPYRVTQAGV